MSQYVDADQLLVMIVNLALPYLYGGQKPKQVRGVPGLIKGVFIRSDVDDCLINRGPVTLQVLEDFLILVLTKYVRVMSRKEVIQDIKRARQTEAFLRFTSFRTKAIAGEVIVPWSPAELWDTLFQPWPEDLPRTVPVPEFVSWLQRHIQAGEDLRRAWIDFWRYRFFTDEAGDALSVAGAPLFFRRAVRESGLGFSMLTSRAESTPIDTDYQMDLRPSTLVELHRHRFPVGPLYMKSVKNISSRKDGESELAFKTRHFDTHGKLSGSFPLVYIDDKPEVVNAYIHSMARQGVETFLGVQFQGAYRSTVELDPRAVVLRSYAFKA